MSNRVNNREIDGFKMKTVSKEITICNTIIVEVGTTGYRGGDSGHGCRTLFRIKNGVSTDMRCAVTQDKELNSFDDVDEIEIVFGGDSELETFIEALEFAVDMLKYKV